MAKIVFYSCLSLVLLITLGCANKQKKKKPEINKVFKTHIDDDQVKMFSYAITIEKKQRKTSSSRGSSQRGGGGRGGPDGGGARGGGGKGGGGQDSDGDRRGANAGNSDEKQNRFKVLLEESLSKQLANLSYCRDGYMIIDEEVRDRSAVVNGKCTEKASEQDRMNFPNEKVRPIAVPEEDLAETYKL